MLRLAKETETQLLTQLSKEAFATDVTVGASEVQGPPMYDNAEWHSQIQKMNILYAIVEQAQIVGGMIIYPNETEPGMIEIGRIFLAPQQFRKGYGLKAMKDAEALFPDATGFNLDTPVWNVRTQRFYQKLGYKETGRNQYLILFEKRR